MTEQESLTSSPEWQVMKDEIETISGLNILPLKAPGDEVPWTVESLSSTIKELEEEPFTVFVCGSVKAGKSTFLNSIVFENSVLPTRATPLTAKVTFIEYTEGKNYFVVNFYSREEWEAYRRSLSSDQKTEFDKIIKVCGVSEGETIGKEPLRVDLPNLSAGSKALEIYATDPNQQHARKYYTPFVKDIHIYVNKTSIKDIRIVDSPGLNDSNQINSAETSRWIRNAHAVIYLLPKRPPDGSDVEFLENHFLETSPESRIFVINKTDQLEPEDEKDVVESIRDLGYEQKFKEKNLFGPREVICRYSSTLDLTRTIEKRGEKPDPELRSGEREPGFDPDPDHIRDKIKQRLYENEGKHRIARGIGTILEIYEKKIDRLKAERSQSIAMIEDCSKTDEELEREIFKLDDEKSMFADFFNKTKNDAECNLYKDVLFELEQKINAAFKKLGSLDLIGDEAVTGIKRFLSVYSSKVYILFSSETESEIKKELREIPNKVLKFRNDIREEIIGFYLKNTIDDPVIFESLKQIEKPDLQLDTEFEKMIKKVEKELPGRFSELFTANEPMCNNVRTAIETFLRESRKTIIDPQIKAYGESILETNIYPTIDNLAGINDSRCESKQKIKKASKEERAKLLQTHEKRKKRLTNDIKKIERYKKTFQVKTGFTD